MPPKDDSDANSRPKPPPQPQKPAKRSALSSITTVPAPVKRLFDKFPLVTYAANELPHRAPRERQRPQLYIFTTEDGAQRGEPSFNPSCLKWQVRHPHLPPKLERTKELTGGVGRRHTLNSAELISSRLRRVTMPPPAVRSRSCCQEAPMPPSLTSRTSCPRASCRSG